MPGRSDSKMVQYATDLKKAMDDLATREDRVIEYIVLDPVAPRTAVYYLTDKGDRRFVSMHPSVIENLPRDHNPEHYLATTWGVPIYERHQLPEGWGVIA